MSDSIVSERQKFKRTPAGNIPVDWAVKSIGELAECVAGGTPKTSVPEYWNGDIRWMNSGELNLKRVTEVEGRITEAGLQNSNAKIIPTKCVLIGLAGQGKTRGTVAMNLVEICTNQSIAAILPNSAFVAEYLYYNLDFRYDELRRLSGGDSGRGGLNLSAIRSLLIPLPPLPEQQKIAAILLSVDENIQIVKHLASICHKLQAALTRKIFLEWPRRRGATVPIRECVTINSEALGNRTDPNRAISYIDIATISKPGVMHSPKSMIFQDAPSRARRVVRQDDVLVSTVRPYLRAFVRIKSDIPNLIASTGFAVLTPEKGLRSDYLYHYVMSDEFVHFLEERMTGSNYPAVTPRDVGECPIPLLPVADQKKVAQMLGTIDEYALHLEDSIRRHEQLKQGLASRLLSGKIRVV